MDESHMSGNVWLPGRGTTASTSCRWFWCCKREECACWSGIIVSPGLFSMAKEQAGSLFSTAPCITIQGALFGFWQHRPPLTRGEGPVPAYC